VRYAATLALLACFAFPIAAQDNSEGPTSEKAQKSFAQAREYARKRMIGAALDDFKKADKQDGGRCLRCQKDIIKYAVELGDWKSAENAAAEMVAEAQEPKELARAHYQLGKLFLDQGLSRHKDDQFEHAHNEMAAAVAAYAKYPSAYFADGLALAHLKRDDAAKAQFEQYVAFKQDDSDPERQRAERYIGNIELARARLAPAFAVTTLDGQRISLDDLTGKVVLIDFWATWCEPCREALPHIQKIAQKFQGQPLVVLSVSLDSDEGKWKEFVAKNEMNWPQYRDGGFTGPVSKLFAVEAIPHTFTIDADGVLEDEHIGGASIEGKLKKLVARAQQLQPASKSASASP
jgi:thiol-disulfide isomerase/thioredoxin